MEVASSSRWIGASPALMCTTRSECAGVESDSDGALPGAGSRDRAREHLVHRETDVVQIVERELGVGGQ